MKVRNVTSDIVLLQSGMKKLTIFPRKIEDVPVDFQNKTFWSLINAGMLIQVTGEENETPPVPAIPEPVAEETPEEPVETPAPKSSRKK